MKKFWEGFKTVAAFIGGLLAIFFYIMLGREKQKNIDTKLQNANQEAELKAKERHEKVRDDPVDTANDIADILRR